MQQEMVYTKQPNDRTLAELKIDGEAVSWLTIVPFVIRVGAAEVRMDGIASVSTPEKHRMKGYSRKVFEEVVPHMAEGDAAITMLYGIRSFYPKFGYATAGPGHHIYLTDLNLSSELPAGWSVREFAAEDLPAARELYRLGTLGSTGTAIRSDDSEVWTHLAESVKHPEGDACRVIVGPDGKVHAYAWLAGWCNLVRYTLGRRLPDTLIVGEAMADSPTAADALLAACRPWAREAAAEREVTQVLLPMPPDTVIAAAAMYQDARFVRDFVACGGSMVRVLDVKRVLTALAPELSARLKSSSCEFCAALTISTDVGAAALHFHAGEVRVEEARGEGVVVDMPQTALGRLALGALPPEEILARLPHPPDDRVRELLRTLFPARYPHMYAADRY